VDGFGEVTESIVETKRLGPSSDVLEDGVVEVTGHFHQVINSRTIQKRRMRQDRVFNEQMIVD
jgi:hypothetical protein